jgi:OOP family OmpA-OmpF porin
MVAVINKNNESSSNEGMSNLTESELATLRRLLMGPDYEKLLKHKITLENPELLAKHISPVVSEALKLRAKDDSSLQKTLNPIITGALLDSVSNDPKPIADALYPIMGPAIRKSINTTMNQMMSNFNELLEQSVSPKSWQWRFDAWRTGRSYAEVVLANNLVFQVEQVFLIHRETGLLLQHVLADTAISKDPDMVSGMLTAIQDFTSDSFSVEENSGLSTLKLGDLTVLIEQSPSAVLAAVIRGTVPQGMQNVLSETLESIHHQESKHLQHYDGNPDKFEHLQPELANCLRIKKKKNSSEAEDKNKQSENKSSKFIWLIIPLLILGLSYAAYYSHLDGKNWIDAQAQLAVEPGLIITQAVEQDGEYRIFGLRDPLARMPQNVVNSDIMSSLPLELDFKPYLSLEPGIVLIRVKEALLVPTTVNLKLKDEILYASGQASPEWIKEFRLRAPLFAGIKMVNLNQLAIRSE